MWMKPIFYANAPCYAQNVKCVEIVRYRRNSFLKNGDLMLK